MTPILSSINKKMEIQSSDHKNMPKPSLDQSTNTGKKIVLYIDIENEIMNESMKST